MNLNLDSNCIMLKDLMRPSAWKKVRAFYMLFVKVLEKGNAYLTLNLKGLELQETSCHSLEATRIDNIFEAAFEQRALFNIFPFHALTPLGQLEVLVYAESQQLLSDVMKNRKTFKLIAESFMEAMVFLLVDFAKKYNRRQKSAPGWQNILRFNVVQYDSRGLLR
jgi:hypothetical protein